MPRVLDPPPLTIEQALATDDPVFEIGIRLRDKPLEAMSTAEKVFWSVSYFVGDTMNGGLLQTMNNSTGDFLDVVGEFAGRYGPPELVEIVAGVHAVFPGGRAPMKREERMDFLDPFMEQEIDPFDALTTRFYAIESAIRSSLISLVEQNRGAFALA